MGSHEPVTLMLFVAMCAVLPCAVYTSALTKAALFQDGHGNLHINSTTNQTVFINGIDVVRKLTELETQFAATFGQNDSLLPISSLDNNGTLQWVRQFGTTGRDIAQRITADGLGGIYIVGSTTGVLGGTFNSGGYDVFIRKYNTHGVEQWTRQFGSNQTDYGNHISIHMQSIYVSWRTGSSSFFAKLNNMGMTEWTHHLFDGAVVPEDKFVYVCGHNSDRQGNFFIAGWADAGVDGNIHVGDSDLFLTKFDSNGVKQWTRQIGSSASETCQGMAIDSNDNVYLTGYTMGSLEGQTYTGYSDVFVLKFNGSSGKIQWVRQIGTPELDRSYAIALDKSNNVYITGTTEGGLDGGFRATRTDMFVLKLYVNGTLSWIEQHRTSHHTYGNDVACDSNDNVYIASYTNGREGKKHFGSWDTFVTKYDSGGARDWTFQIGSNMTENWPGIAVDNNNNAFIVSKTDGEVAEFLNDGDDDVFVVKLGNP